MGDVWEECQHPGDLLESQQHTGKSLSRWVGTMGRWINPSWVTFEKGVNIKEICWNLNNIWVSLSRWVGAMGRRIDPSWVTFEKSVNIKEICWNLNNIRVSLSRVSEMVQWIFRSIVHSGRIGLFLVQPVLHDWFNKGCGMCYPVCVMVHIKEPLLLIGKSSPGGSSRFPLVISTVLYHMSDVI